MGRSLLPLLVQLNVLHNVIACASEILSCVKFHIEINHENSSSTGKVSNSSPPHLFPSPSSPSSIPIPSNPSSISSIDTALFAFCDDNTLDYSTPPLSYRTLPYLSTDNIIEDNLFTLVSFLQSLSQFHYLLHILSNEFVHISNQLKECFVSPRPLN